MYFDELFCSLSVANNVLNDMIYMLNKWLNESVKGVKIKRMIV